MVRLLLWWCVIVGIMSKKWKVQWLHVRHVLVIKPSRCCQCPSWLPQWFHGLHSDPTLLKGPPSLHFIWSQGFFSQRLFEARSVWPLWAGRENYACIVPLADGPVLKVTPISYSWNHIPLFTRTSLDFFGQIMEFWCYHFARLHHFHWISGWWLLVLQNIVKGMPRLRT